MGLGRNGRPLPKENHMTTFTPLAPSAFPGTTVAKQVDEGGVAVPSRTVADVLFRSTATVVPGNAEGASGVNVVM